MTSVKTKLIDEEELGISLEERSELEQFVKCHYPSTWRITLNAMMVGYALGKVRGERKAIDKFFSDLLEIEKKD